MTKGRNKRKRKHRIDSLMHGNAVPALFIKPFPASTTPVFETYWKFAFERQAIFFRRLEGEPEPWTNDPILRIHKFTNAYRASDRVSQYLIRHVIYSGKFDRKNTLFRILLFKMFNKIGTWERLRNALGEVTWQDYSFKVYDQILTEAMSAGERVYSAAYIMPSGGRLSIDGRKHRTHLRLLERIIRDDVADKLGDTNSMQQGFLILRSYPMIGNFLAYQYITDINYSELTNYKEMDFVIPGPGARDGIRKCFSDFGGLTEPEIIRLMADRQEMEFERFGLTFRSLWGRRLQLIDCQNLFCEVDKYARVKHPEYSGLSGRTRIKQIYRKNDLAIPYWYPPKWDINAQIPEISPSSSKIKVRDNTLFEAKTRK